MKKLILILLLFIVGCSNEKYIIEDNYNLLISYPIIGNKKIDKKINNFIEENKKLYQKNNSQLVINYERNIYDELTLLKLNSFIYFNNENKDYVEHSLLLVYNDLYELLDLTQKEIESIKNIDNINMSIEPIKRDLTKYKNKKLIALTFDDGPSVYTKYLLDELNKRDAKVTFFVIGNKVNEYADTISKAYLDGHQIGNHTYNHKNLFYLNDDNIRTEINKTNELIYNIIGVYPNVLRVPYGNVNYKIKNIAKMNNISWNIDTLDWKYKSVNRIYKRILKSSDGDIVLLHDIFKTSIKAVLKAIDTLKEQGYEFVTIDEMAYLKEINMDYNKTYFYFN